jgi:glycosyltransferase involved in cell wall biosynthesis
VDAVACGPDGRLINILEDQRIPVHVIPHLQSPPSPVDVLAYRELRKIISDGGYDLIHSHSTKAGLLTRIAANRIGVASIFTVHGWGFYNTKYRALRPIMIRGERALSERTDEIVCVSENDRKMGYANGILQGLNGTVIHNGICPLDPSPGRNTVYNEFNIDPDVPVIGAIARLAPQKNPLRILDIAKQLQERGHDFATMLIGSGPLGEECQRYVDEHNIHEAYLPGFREDALELLQDFDAFLLPSRFEGFPVTVLECLHAGVPIIAHNVGGVSEAVDNAVTGFIVSPSKPDHEFVDCVERILTSPRKRDEMGRRAQQVASARFTEDRMVDEYQEVYQRVLS